MNHLYPPLTAEQRENLLGNQPDADPPATAYLVRDDIHMVHAAQDRRRVRINGRGLGTLAYWPIKASDRLNHAGGRARVILDSGAWLSVDTDAVELIEETG